MNLLLLSNGRKKPGKLLEFALSDISDFVSHSDGEILFIPYARVLMNWDEYTKQVEDAFSTTNYKIKSIHREKNMIGALTHAKCILVGGGNTLSSKQICAT